MNLTEKSAYIKGLADGLELDKTTKEGKILAALLELVDEMTAEIASVKKDIEEIVQVVACRHCDAAEGLDFSTAVDLTDRLQNGLIYWDIPEGVWRICVMIRTNVGFGHGDRFSYYIDMLEQESCKAMIDAVYEPHYQHFKEYFGNTFKGFFSDEPHLSNCWFSSHSEDPGMYERRLGLLGMALLSMGVIEAATFATIALVTNVLMWAMAVLTVVSGMQYIVPNFDLIKNAK